MTREEAKKAAEVMHAYAMGKEIEYRLRKQSLWQGYDSQPGFDWVFNDYRIKPNPKYRPFKDARECWQEMQKHQPFGWVYSSQSMTYKQILSVEIYGDAPIMVYGQGEFTLNDMFETYTFADGEPFGMKV